MCVPGCREAVQRATSRRRFFTGAAAAAGLVATGVEAAHAQRTFASVIDLPAPGCWRVDLTAGSLHGTTTFLALNTDP